MKRNITLLFYIFLTLNLSAQTVKTKQTVKTLIQERSITLNGGANATFGGTSRTVIQIALPNNTVSWYYSFSTSPGASGKQTLNLFAQMSTLALNPLGILKGAASSVQVPEGTGSINAYLLDQRNSDWFLQKTEFSYFREGNAMKTSQGVVPIYDALQGTYYIGLQNPGTFDGINITIEVVAVIEEEIQQTDEESQALTMGNLAWKAFQRGDYDRCLDLSKQALALDNTLAFVHFNVALSYLIKGQNTEAVTEYTKAISVTKKTADPKETFKGAIDDLKTYMDKFPSKPDAEDILDLLKQELKKY